ncbi:MAG: formylglycine-generating enzyme family protein [Nitrospina sp.]|nr:formylglycine-generating enzyme family protein [Nitrospina sp.]
MVTDLKRKGFGIVLFLFAVLAGSLDSLAGEAPTPPEGMVYLPGGEFVMGREGSSNKTPHKVVLSPVFIGKHEVTQAEYERVTGTNPSGFKGADLPVEQVTWFEAWTYCRKTGGRLPTEAEWEYAARGGTTTDYFWGDEFETGRTWNEENSQETTHPVGAKPGNGFGLHDTSGNVWEWVADWYDKHYYERSPLENPPGPEAGEEKVIRGGSWYSSGSHQMSATRYWAEPATRNSNFGFRCVKDIS